MDSAPRDVVISWLFGEGTTGSGKTTVVPILIAFTSNVLAERVPAAV
jgi:hypothetical protein